jgi:CDP-6-deoxy-D-xylo-4-hexulose-3-dehydrase
LTGDTRAVFLTHILGYNALTQPLLDELAAREIPLIEDACESHGATFNGRKVGTFGWMADFSFYYAHHLSTVEGGMISTNDPELYQVLRMLRSHGMVREANDETVRQRYYAECPDLNRDFIFAFPAYNVRPTEIAALIGRTQLHRLDANNQLRTANLKLFLENLDAGTYQTDFAVAGSSNYAFTLVLRQPDGALWARIEETLRAHGVEFRRGLSGGGNQLRQPFVRRLLDDEYTKYPNVDHVHFYGCYIGNYPALEQEKIRQLCALLNAVAHREGK